MRLEEKIAITTGADSEMNRQTAVSLIERIDAIRLHAHTYPFILNLTHGSMTPFDLLDFAYQHELQGVNVHIDDGGKSSLANSDAAALARFKQMAERLNLTVHLETSHTDRAEIDRMVRIASALGVQNMRVYSRYEGTVSEIMAITATDLHYMAKVADKYDLYFDFEQHETIKSGEIVQLLQKINHSRIHALFDFTNMINADERPLTALHILAPIIRQVHLKGAKRLKEGDGYGQVGVLQGSTEDEMPYARMLYELLLLGEAEPQVICFALEQEVNYYAPAYRQANEGDDPFIPHKEPSSTPFDSTNAAIAFLNEKRWANNQVYFIKNLLAELKWLAQCFLEELI
jgi:sugar phosphate isomerase/epimerase